MANKLKDDSKDQPRAEPAENPPPGEGEAVLSETHSQDADRHRKARHPHSDK